MSSAATRLSRAEVRAAPTFDRNMLRRILFPQTPAPAAVRYGFAVACCVAAFAARLLLEPLLKERSPLLLFELAVAVSALRGGFGPGIFSTVAGALSALYFFPSTGSIFILPEYRPTVAIQLAVFFMVGVILSWVGGELRELRWKALKLADDRNEILESITDGFEALDAGYRFVYLNQAAARLYGSPRDEMIGRNIWDRMPELRGTQVEKEFRGVLERRVVAHFEYLFQSSSRWFEFHAHPAANGGLTVYFRDVTDRKSEQLRLRQTLLERDAAVENVRVLRGLLPICAACKKIRDEQGSWQQMESYISGHSQAKFSHGLCPDCAQRYLASLEEIDQK